jgi:hypothetical protein
MGLLDLLKRRPRAQASLGIATIALTVPHLPPKHVLARRMREQLPQLPPLRDAETRGDLLGFACGSAQVSLALMRAPLPARQRERLEVRTPRARTLLEQHTAHLFVTVKATVKEPDEGELLLRSIVKCVAALSPSCGVCWGEGPTLYSSEEFVGSTGARRASTPA